MKYRINCGLCSVWMTNMKQPGPNGEMVFKCPICRSKFMVPSQQKLGKKMSLFVAERLAETLAV